LIVSFINVFFLYIRMLRGEKGLSQSLVILIGIAIIIVFFGIIYLSFSIFYSVDHSNIEFASIGDINVSNVILEKGILSFDVKKKSSNENIKGVNVVLESEDGSTESYNFSTDLYSTERINIDISKSTLNKILKFSIYPIEVSVLGLEQTGSPSVLEFDRPVSRLTNVGRPSSRGGGGRGSGGGGGGSGSEGNRNICGNGIINGNEQCDDGNTASSDGCSSGCLNELIVNINSPLDNNTYGVQSIGFNFSIISLPGYLSSCWYSLDGVNQTIAACVSGENYNLISSVAGSHNINLYINGTDNSRVSKNVQFSIVLGQTIICGNNITEQGETCDGNNLTCTINSYLGNQFCNNQCIFNNCTLTESCGDGFINGLEACDDGVMNGQPNKCNLLCTNITSYVCGNGLREGTETCDDGNVINGDGCSSLCITETPSVVCGNGIIQSGEQCDDGNVVNGDGCSSQCLNEQIIINNSGIQGSLFFEAESGNLLSFSQFGGSIYQANDSFNIGSGGKAVYNFNINNSGSYIITAGVNASDLGSNSFFINIDSNPDSSMVWDVNPLTFGKFALRNVSWRGSGSATVNQYDPKNFSLSSGSHQLIIMSREKNTYIDNFTIIKLGSSVITPSVICGNGIIQLGEQCDDGNLVNGDGCSSSCIIETFGAVCGNNITEIGETCDDNNVINGDGCSSLCQIENVTIICGNNIIEAGESCDDGNLVNGDGCSSNCTIETPIEVCGNRIREGSETCDSDSQPCTSNGYSGSKTCNSQCNDFDACILSESCGDGIINGNEACDDGNINNDDGCSAQCIIEPPKCLITSLAWSPVSAIEGDAVSLTATGSNCDGKTIDFSVLEDDFPLGVDQVNINPPSVTFSGGVARSTWTAEWQCDGDILGICILGNPEYYFVVNVSSVAQTVNSKTYQNGVLTTTANTPVCGNNITQTGEQCDDGNIINGDGCSATCQNEISEGPFFFEAENGVFSGSVTNAGNYITLATGGSAAYQFNINNPGNYIVTSSVNAPDTGANSFFVGMNSISSTDDKAWDIVSLTSGFNLRNISIRGTGSSSANEFNPKVFALSAGNHTLFIAGREAGTQLDNLRIIYHSAIAPSVCGNSVIDGIEQCDDGNTISGDGCSSTCTSEMVVPVCGNSLREGTEQCDDGNVINGDGCNSVCQTEIVIGVCGNRVIEGYEQCDDGNIVSGDGCSSICILEGVSSNTVSLGVNIGNYDGNYEYVRNYIFVDVIKTSRILYANGGYTPEGWPIGDFTVFAITIDNCNGALRDGNGRCINSTGFLIPDISGTYSLSFKGQANVGAGGVSSVQNKVYNSDTGYTSAQIVVPSTQQELFLYFSGTNNKPITNIKLLRPGYPAGTTQAFTNEFIYSIQPFTTIRLMDYLRTNWCNEDPVWVYNCDSDERRASFGPTIEWSERTLPTDATINGPAAGSIELMVQLANEQHKDLWINIPHYASDDYIQGLADYLKNGETINGVFYPPLNSNSKIYLEFSNELWNTFSAFEQSGVVRKATQDYIDASPANAAFIQNPNTNIYYDARRFTLFKIFHVSTIFRQTFGDSQMITRIRPVFADQVSWPGLMGDTLNWAYRSYPHPPSYYLYGIAGAPYIGSPNDVASWGNSTQIVADELYDVNNRLLNAPMDFSMVSYPYYYSMAQTYGMKTLSYEGGTHLTENVNVANKIATSYDPTEENVIRLYLASWYACGGDLFMYFNHASPYGGEQWGLTEDVRRDYINQKFFPKMKAARSVAQSNINTFECGPSTNGIYGQSFTGVLGNGTGLLGTYYNGGNFGTVALNRIEPVINFVWAYYNTLGPIPTSRSDGTYPEFSVRWTGKIMPKYSGLYRFELEKEGNDVASVIVNGQNLGTDGTISLTGGNLYTIQISFQPNGGSGKARLWWSSSGGANGNQIRAIVPKNQLYPN